MSEATTNGEASRAEAEAELLSRFKNKKDRSKSIISKGKHDMIVERLPANVPLSYRLFFKFLREEYGRDFSVKSLLEQMTELYCEHNPQFEHLAKRAVEEAISTSAELEMERLKKKEKELKAQQNEVKKKIKK